MKISSSPVDCTDDVRCFTAISLLAGYERREDAFVRRRRILPRGREKKGTVRKKKKRKKRKKKKGKKTEENERGKRRG